MELDEAINVIQTVKNRYQAFERLEEALRFVAGLTGYQKEVQAALDKTKAQHTEAQAKLDELNSNVSNAQKNLTALTDTHTRRSIELQNSHDETAQELEDEYKARHAQLEQELSAKQKETSTTVADLTKQVDTKRTELAEHSTRLEGIKAEIEAMKEKAKTLFGG